MRMHFAAFANSGRILLAALPLLLLQSCLFSGGGGGKGEPYVNRGYFSFPFPYPGMRLHLDSSYTVTWIKTDSVNDPLVRLSLYRGDNPVLVWPNAMSNNGEFLMSLPTVRSLSAWKVGSGSNYRLKIASASDSTQWDFSRTFSLYSSLYGTFSVTAPAAGATARIDSSLSIAWDYTGNPGASVGIQLFKDTALVGTVITSTANDRNHTWPLVSTTRGTGSDYRIRVYSYSDPAVSATSASFQIRSTYDGTLTITSPKAGDSLAAGSSHVVTWSSTGTPGSLVSLQLWRDSTWISNLATGANASTGSMTWSVPPGMLSSDRYRIRIASYYDAGIFSFSPYFSIRGLAADSSEPDNLRSSAKALAEGQTQQRTLTYQDSDWVQINAVAGRRYLAGIQSNFTLYAQVMDSAGNALSTTQSGSQLQVAVNPTYAGRHYLLLRYYSTSSSYQGPYSLTLRGYDSSQSSFPVKFNAPDSTTTWAAGSSYSIQWTPDSVFYGSSVRLQLYQDTVPVLTISSIATNSGSYSWFLPAGMATGSRYRIRITNYSNALIHAYSPFFAISGVAGDSYEPDNIRTAAKSLADSATQQRTLTYSDTDWVQLQISSARRYLVGIQSNFTLYAQVLDSNGSQLSTQSGSRFQINVNPAYSGRHYLRFLPYSTSSSYQGPYAVSLRSYDSSQSNFPVTFSAPASGATWAAGSSYAINWSPDSIWYGNTVSLALVRDTTFVLSISSGVLNSGTYTWSVPAGTATGSNYRIRIANYSNPLIRGHSPAFAISGLNPDSFETDNSRGQAKAIAPDGSLQQRTLTYLDSDWVQINAIAGRRYLATAQTTFYLYLSFADSSGNILATAPVSTSRSQVTFSPAYSGRHYALVRYYSTSSLYQGPYALSVYGYDSTQNGLPARFLSPDSGTSWASGSSYAVTWTPDSMLFGSFVALNLFRDSVQLLSLTSSASNSGTYTWSIPAGLGSSNRYRIRMANNSNSQLFGFSPHFAITGMPQDSLEPNDAPTAARTIAPNAGRRNLTLTYADRDWFQFSGTDQRLYVVQVIAPVSLYNTVRVYSGLGGTQLATATRISTLDSVTSLAWYGTAAGTHSISVDPYSVSTSYTGNYGLEFREYTSAQYQFNVTAPVAGATAVHSQSLSVAWSNQADVRGTVDLFLYNSSGPVMTVVAGAANTGAYSWTVPATVPPGSDYFIRVVSRVHSDIAGNSGVFTVSAN